MRTMSFIDKVISEIDTALRTISPPVKRAALRSSPADTVEDSELNH